MFNAEFRGAQKPPLLTFRCSVNLRMTSAPLSANVDPGFSRLPEISFPVMHRRGHAVSGTNGQRREGYEVMERELV